jgi:hypothetical protein
VAACSLVNSFDPIKYEADASTPAIDAGGDEMDVVTSMTDSAPPIDSFVMDEPDVSVPNGGVIVIGGSVRDDAGTPHPILTAIDPATGAELPHARESLTVAAVQYDGLRDYWYVWESGGVGIFPNPTDPVFLHVRQLDTHTGDWTELQRLKVPPLVSFSVMTVLRERLEYIAYDSLMDGNIGADLVSVDTTDPSNVSVTNSQLLDVQPIGLIGTRSSTQNGGSINMLRSVPCPDGGICLELQHVIVAADQNPELTSIVALGPYVGSPAYGSFIQGGPLDVIGWTTKVPNTSISTYSPQVPGNVVGTPIPFSSNDGVFKPFAFAECLGQALMIGTNQDLAVYAIPLTSATGVLARGTTQHSGEAIYFEPYTSTILAPFSQGAGFELTAFKLSGTAAAPVITARTSTDWNPPADVRPSILATRTPLPIVCQ